MNLNLKKIEFVETTISPAFAQFITETCGDTDNQENLQLDAIEFYRGDISELLYSPDSIVIMQRNKDTTAFQLRGTETTINLIVAGFIQHLENQVAANEDDLLTDLV